MHDEQDVTLATGLERLGGIGTDRTTPTTRHNTTLTNTETLHIAENRIHESDKRRFTRHGRSGDLVEFASQILATMENGNSLSNTRNRTLTHEHMCEESQSRHERTSTAASGGQLEIRGFGRFVGVVRSVRFVIIGGIGARLIGIETKINDHGVLN